MIILTTFCFLVSYFLVVYDMVPHLERASIDGFVVTIIRTSVPTLVFWLTFWFGLWHAYSEGLSEIMRFGERRAYGEWWAVTDLVYIVPREINKS